MPILAPVAFPGQTGWICSAIGVRPPFPAGPARNLFDIAVGHDNIFKGDRYKVSARLTVVNLTDKEALYNFLSTFSGTHYVTPRTVGFTLGLHF